MAPHKYLFRCCPWPLALIALLASCSSQKTISKIANKKLIQAGGLKNAHVGISIYKTSTHTYLYNYSGDRHFVPASNTKIPTCYAAMKYLGDSILGMKVTETPGQIFLLPTGDPTLLDPEFARQPVFNFLKSTQKELVALPDNFETSAWGSGWSWDDYDADYLAERSSLPLYSNVGWFYGKSPQGWDYFPKSKAFQIKALGEKNQVGQVTRELRENLFRVELNGTGAKEIRVPFITSQKLAWELLSDTLKKPVRLLKNAEQATEALKTGKTYQIYSQPTDSVLRILMHRSDNFFAEQLLLMTSGALLHKMTSAGVIDTILQTDFAALPQKPRWADGSGLSRYNLFTPQDFVFILNKMKDEFGMERIKSIFPTGGTGTLASYYKSSAGAIFAKTGSLSGVVALSGFVVTQKKQLLIFSVLVNNHQTTATEIRKAIEAFILKVRKRY